MIRILQQDSRVTKAFFALIISAVVIFMVITLVPGVFDNGDTNDATVYATVRSPGYFARFTGDSTPIKMDDVLRETQAQMRRQNIPDSPIYEQILMPRVGQQEVERAVLLHEADRLGLEVSDADLASELKTLYGQYLYPDGKFIGQDAYVNFVEQLGISVSKFEEEVKDDIEIQRLQALVTGSVSVSDAAVKADTLKTGTKIKFDYATISAEDVKKSLNPTDADLQAFFKQNASRYATAIPETRKLQLFAFDSASLPKATVSDAAVQSYYNAHQDQYSVPASVHARHILIAAPKTADAKTDAAAKAKAQDVLNQVKAGGDFAALAKKYSDDPGSKDKGGDLGMQPASMFVPVFSQAAMALNPGQTSGLVRSDFGYHIIQTIEKQPAHTKSLAEVHDQIAEQLQNQNNAAAAQSYANQLAAEAKSKGMAATAAAHSLHVETTDYLGKDGTIGILADSTSVLNAAFTAAKGSAPQAASTGEGFAVFQVVDVKAAHAPEFADWKSHVLEDYREQKAPELLQQKLTQLATVAKAGGDLHKAAAAMGLTVKTSDLVGSDGQVADLGAMTGEAAVAFDLPVGGISGPINEGANGAVLQIVDKQQPSAEDLAKSLPATRAKLQQQEQGEAFGVFAGELMERYEKAGAIAYSKKQAPVGPFGN
jgi:peptidyl-prolyl cis-trans isomerase D